jgi:hypothetical protein
MARKAEYIDRLPSGLDWLRHWCESPEIGRRTIEIAFRCSRWSALRILRQCEGLGAAALEVGGVLLYRRDDIVGALERLLAGEAPEIGRRRRFQASILSAAESARLRSVLVAPAGAPSDRLRATVELPAGVTLDRPGLRAGLSGAACRWIPGRLVIEFADRGDFLTRLAAVVYALQNDYDGVMSRVSDV